MALDRTFALKRLPRPTSAAQLDGEPPAGCSIIPAPSIAALSTPGWEEVAFIVLDSDRNLVERAIAEAFATSDPYGQLEAAGIFVVSPYRPDGDGLLLAGGSYSQVSLHVEDGAPIVRKRLDLDGRISQDRELRQIQEIEWLTAVPASVGELFAPVLRTRRSAEELELTTGFVPGYTLAELVFQGRLDGAGLASTLEGVYSQVSSTLWSQPPLPVSGARGESYVQRTQRRTRAMLASDYRADGILRSFLQAQSVVVNGHRCVGPTRLLETLERDRSWDPVVHPTGKTLCHGDLILEDILISPDTTHGFSLVDPNPANDNPLYDLGKTMMSLWLAYEPIYFDLFSIQWRVAPDAGLEVEVELVGEAPAVYRDAAERFFAFVERELAGSLALPREQLHSALRMSAAIHMLAITVFHLLHHRREERALAFAATAMLHAQCALEARPPALPA